MKELSIAIISTLILFLLGISLVLIGILISEPTKVVNTDDRFHQGDGIENANCELDYKVMVIESPDFIVVVNNPNEERGCHNER